MSKKDIRKRHQEYVNSIVSKLTKLFVFFILICALPAAAQPASEAGQLSSESCSLAFYNLACDIIHSKNINQVEAEKAIVLLKAARDLDNKADFVVSDLIQLCWRYPERDRSDLIYELLTDYLEEKTDRQTLKMAASYLLDKTNNRNQRELLINGLLQISRAKNSYLSSELLTSLGLLRSELSDPNTGMYFIGAYNYNEYNRLAFAKLLELMPDELNPLAYLEHLRLIFGENPLDINSAVNFAEYARKLQLYQAATDAYEYCSQLYRYLYPSQKLPSYIYLPWSISAYNTERSRYKCLQIADEVEKEGGFDLILKAITAKASVKMDDKEQAVKMFEEAEKKAKANYFTDTGKQSQTSKIETCSSLAWFYCFAREDANQALEWATKAHAIEPNSSTTNGLLAYIKNNSTEPIIISDDGLFSGNIRVDAKIRGDINKDIPNLLSLKYQPIEPIEPGKSLFIPLNLNIGELRRILTGHPQASLGILFTFYLDPVITENKKVANRLADIEPVVCRATRTAEKISSSYLRYRINSLSGGRQGQKVRTAKLFAALLAEQQDMFKRRTSYQFMYADRMPAVLKSALQKCLKDEDWNVKMQTMAVMVGLTLDSKLTNDVAENLNDSEWPARLMAMYLLEKNGYDFGKILDRTARYDSNPLVREMAVALGGTAPEPKSEPEPVVPPGLIEPNQTISEFEPNQTISEFNLNQTDANNTK